MSQSELLKSGAWSCGRDEIRKTNREKQDQLRTILSVKPNSLTSGFWEYEGLQPEREATCYETGRETFADVEDFVRR